MAKVDRPLFSDEATGELAKTLAFKLGGEYCRLEKKRLPAKSRTSGQAFQRDFFLATRSAWRSLTEEQRSTWNAGAPSGWTGFNYYLFVNLRSSGTTLGALVFGKDLVNQGNLSGRYTSANYENNFPGSSDTIPTFADGADPVKAWILNDLAASLAAIQSYILAHRAIIERG